MYNNELNKEENTLLDIFQSEKDRKSSDLLEMSNYFEVFIGKISSEVNYSGAWEDCGDAGSFLGQIAASIKAGFDISQIGMLVADTTHFSQEIIDGLKSGLYHIGQSKEVAGNFRPAVLDDKERLVKFITLKKALNPAEVLADISTLSMQVSLNRINEQIADVGKAVKSVNNLIRRETLSKPFLCARDRIMSAVTAHGDDREIYLHEADTYLMNGLISLYIDIDEQVKELAGLRGPFRSLKAVDDILNYINEDMQMIPRYVGTRVYLLNYRGMQTDVNRVVGDYRYHLESLFKRKTDSGKYSALELIHKYYPYEDGNTDFWLKEPKKMLLMLDACENMIDQKNKEIFFINASSEEFVNG